MRSRLILTLAAVGAVSAIGAPVASATAPQAQHAAVKSFFNKNKIVQGFYKGAPVKYFELGVVKLAPGNTVAPIWTVTNGAPGQGNIIDVAPGDKGYTPLWAVKAVTFKDGVTARLLKSKADVDKAVAAGDVTVKAMKVVVNCPVV